jgi:hypothetical protein
MGDEWLVIEQKQIDFWKQGPNAVFELKFGGESKGKIHYLLGEWTDEKD